MPGFFWANPAEVRWVRSGLRTRPELQFPRSTVRAAHNSARGSVPARSRCAQLVDPHGPVAEFGRSVLAGLGIGSVVEGGSVGAAKKSSCSSTYSHRTALSVVLKIRVSMVRFRPRPPVSKRPSALLGFWGVSTFRRHSLQFLEGMCGGL